MDDTECGKGQKDKRIKKKKKKKKRQADPFYAGFIDTDILGEMEIKEYLSSFCISVYLPYP